jgi:hypothetical protein
MNTHLVRVTLVGGSSANSGDSEENDELFGTFEQKGMIL